MRASHISVTGLHTIEACEKAIYSIERDYDNHLGGLKDWVNTRTNSVLLVGASKKIDAINRRSDALYLKWIKEEYKAYLAKGNPVVTFDHYYDNGMFC